MQIQKKIFIFCTSKFWNRTPFPLFTSRFPSTLLDASWCFSMLPKTGLHFLGLLHLASRRTNVKPIGVRWQQTSISYPRKFPFATTYSSRRRTTRRRWSASPFFFLRLLALVLLFGGLGNDAILLTLLHRLFLYVCSRIRLFALPLPVSELFLHRCCGYRHLDLDGRRSKRDHGRWSAWYPKYRNLTL